MADIVEVLPQPPNSTRRATDKKDRDSVQAALLEARRRLVRRRAAPEAAPRERRRSRRSGAESLRNSDMTMLQTLFVSFGKASRLPCSLVDSMEEDWPTADLEILSLLRKQFDSKGHRHGDLKKREQKLAGIRNVQSILLLQLL
jgi:hypothetical protein